jgi:hypothetical protein
LIALLALSTAQPSTSAPDTAERSTDSLDKVVCKRFEVTGSLVSTRKECKTKREWETDRANIRATEAPPINTQAPQ